MIMIKRIRINKYSQILLMLIMTILLNNCNVLKDRKVVNLSYYKYYMKNDIYNRESSDDCIEILTPYFGYDNSSKLKKDSFLYHFNHDTLFCLLIKSQECFFDSLNSGEIEGTSISPYSCYKIMTKKFFFFLAKYSCYELPNVMLDKQYPLFIQIIRIGYDAKIHLYSLNKKRFVYELIKEEIKDLKEIDLSGFKLY